MEILNFNIYFMDQNIIDALYNFGAALEELVDAIETQAKADKNKGDGQVTNSKLLTDVQNSLVVIQESVNEIKSDTNKILENQKTLLTIAKDSEKSGGLLGDLKSNKSNVKDGVTAIMLIAGAVVAIGLAFQLIGNVDFASVIALSLALPLLAMAFTEIATTLVNEKIDYNTLLMTGASILVIASAITISSWILSGIMPIGAYQILTGLGIAIMMGLVIGGISLLGLTFGGLGNMMEDLKKVKFTDIFKLPLIFIAISAAITGSSYILGSIQVISPEKILNAILQGVALGIITTIMMIPMALIAKIGIGIKDVLVGGAMIVIIAAAVALSSQLLALGDYGNYPSTDWALGVGTSILMYSIPVIALGLIATTGIGAIGIALGVGMMLLVASSIVATSLILSKGKYSNSGDMLKWAMSTTLLYGTLTPLILLLGGMRAVGALASVFTFGAAPDPLEEGQNAMLEIAGTIVKTSFILSKGKYSGGPTKEWSEGVAMALIGFSPVFEYMFKSQIGELFGGSSLSANDISNVIKTTSFAIVESAIAFNNAPGVYKTAPTKAWSEGVATAIGSFIPIFDLMFDNSGIFGGSNAEQIEAMRKGMGQITWGIVEVAAILQYATETYGINYVDGPSKAWSEGVGTALASFVPIFEMLFEESGIFTSDDSVLESMRNGMKSLAWGIVEIASILQYGSDTLGVNYSAMPNKDWADSLKHIYETIIEFEELDDTSGIDNMINAIDGLASAMSRLRDSMSGMDSSILSEIATLTKSNLVINAIDVGGSGIGGFFGGDEGNVEIIQNFNETTNEGVNVTNQAAKTEQDMKISDLYNKLSDMDQKLQMIASNSSKISNLMNEMRANKDVGIGF